MSVIRYTATIDIHVVGRSPGPPIEMVERALVMALLRLHLESMGHQGRIELAGLEVADWSLNDRPARQPQAQVG